MNRAPSGVEADHLKLAARNIQHSEAGRFVIRAGRCKPDADMPVDGRKLQIKCRRYRWIGMDSCNVDGVERRGSQVAAIKCIHAA